MEAILNDAFNKSIVWIASPEGVLVSSVTVIVIAVLRIAFVARKIHVKKVMDRELVVLRALEKRQG